MRIPTMNCIGVEPVYFLTDSYWIVDLKVKERLTEHLKKDTKYRRVTIGVNA